MWRRALVAIIARDLKRMLRQRGRLISAMVRPLIWLLVIGTGFQSLVDAGNGRGYQHFLVPGLVGMVILFGSMLASLALVYDKESGVMRMLIIAPFPRYWIILGRTVSASIVGIVQSLMLIVILSIIGYFTFPANLTLFALGLLLTALVCASLGMLVAVYSDTLENFAVIMNFVIFPMFFLSGALYPIQQLPGPLRIIATVNPFSYGVDLIKHGLLSELATYAVDFVILQDIAVMAGFVALALSVACLRFANRAVFETLAGVLSRTRRR